MFPNALICVSSFITITGILLALIVPCEQSYPQMNASCKGTQNTRLCNIHRAQLETILWATSGYGGLFFSVYGMWLCACEHLFPMTNKTHSPICVYQCFGRKQLEKSQKGCLSPFRSIWQDWTSPLVSSLQWGVISAGFNSSLTCIISSSLVEMRDLESLLQNGPRQLELQLKILLLNLSGEVKQSLARGRFVLAFRLEQRALIPMATATMAAVFVVSHLLYYMSRNGPQPLGVQRSLAVIMAHFSTEIAANSGSEKWAAHLSSQPGVCDVWVTEVPLQIWPQVLQRAQRPYIFHKWRSQGCAVWSKSRRCRFRWMDRSRRWRWWRKRRLTTAPLCRLGWKWPLTAPCERLSLKLSQTSSGRFMGPSPLHPSAPPHPCCQLHSLHSEQRGPPLVLSVSFFVPCDPVQPCGRAAAERNVQDTHWREEWENMSLTHSQGHDCFMLVVPQTL